MKAIYIDIVKRHGGRFLDQNDKNNPCWYEVPYERASRKIAQTLRDLREKKADEGWVSIKTQMVNSCTQLASSNTFPCPLSAYRMPVNL